MVIEEHIPLAAYTTFKLGGPARFLLRVRSLDELKEALSFAHERALSTCILGGGSNMLIGEQGFDGAVIKIELRGITQEGERLAAAAGEEWDALVAHSVAAGLWGLENLSGIPGTVGAAPVQNIGAYGAELKDTLVHVDAYDTNNQRVVQFKSDECGFGYRTSRFKKEPGRFVILSAEFKLARAGAPNASYKDLRGAEGLSLEGMRERVRAVRAQKFPDLAHEGTAGSFFLNPVVSADAAARLKARYADLPLFPQADGRVKLSLAWLLDHALHAKGMREGGARLFEKQPLVIATDSSATARDVVALAHTIKDLAKQTLFLDLEEEVRILA